MKKYRFTLYVETSATKETHNFSNAERAINHALWHEFMMLATPAAKTGKVVLTDNGYPVFWTTKLSDGSVSYVERPHGLIKWK